MINRTNLKALASFQGAEWQAIKIWLEAERAQLLSELLNAKTHDESQKHRGAIRMIDKLLIVEKDAASAASR